MLLPVICKMREQARWRWKTLGEGLGSGAERLWSLVGGHRLFSQSQALQVNPKQPLISTEAINMHAKTSKV